MKKTFNLFIGVLIIIASFNQLLAKGDKKENKNQLKKITSQRTSTYLDINNISTWFYNDGRSDITPNSNSGLVYPKGSGKTAVFAAGLLWGAKVTGDPDPRIGGTAYRTGLTPGNVDSNGNPPADKTIDKYRIYRVRPDVYPGGPTVDLSVDAANENTTEANLRTAYELDWNEWPANMGAPYDDINNNSTYEPGIDIPGVPGADQTIWFVANDLKSYQTTWLYGANPLGIELQTTIWAYNKGGTFGNLYFRKYKLINITDRSAQTPTTFNDMYISMFADVDLGDAFDDYIGTDSSLNLQYSYNSKTTDASYNPLLPPVVGFQLLQGPLIIGIAGQDKNKNGVDDAIDFGTFDFNKIGPGKINLPMTAAYYFAAGDPNIGDPTQGTIQGSREFYNYFQGKYGLSGQTFTDYITGQPTRYALNGDPVAGTGWLDGIQLPAGDRRNGFSSGPFTIAPGDTQEVVIAEIVIIDSTILSTANVKSIKTLREKAIDLKDFIKNKAAVTIDSKYLSNINVYHDFTGYFISLYKDDSITNSLWEILSKPDNSNAVISNPTQITAGFTPDIVGDYIIKLTILSKSGLTLTTTKNIQIINNTKPVPSFTLDKTELTWGESVFLDASSSYDPDNDPIEFNVSGFLSAIPRNEKGKYDIYPYINRNNVVELKVEDPYTFETNKKIIKLNPLLYKGTEVYSYLDTTSKSVRDIYYFTDKNIFLSEGDINKVLYIFDINNGGISYNKSISIPGLLYIRSVENNNIFLTKQLEDGFNGSGVFGPGVLDVYSYDNSFNLTNILSNYVPSGDYTKENIWSIQQGDGNTKFIRTYYSNFKFKFYQVDFSNISSPVVKYVHEDDNFSWQSISGDTNYWYVLGREQNTTKIITLTKITFIKIGEILPPADLSISSHNGKYFTLYHRAPDFRIDSIYVAKITNPTTYEILNTIKVEKPTSNYFFDNVYRVSNFSLYNDIIPDKLLLVIRDAYGFLIYDVTTPNTSTKIGSIHIGGGSLYLNNFGTFFVTRENYPSSNSHTISKINFTDLNNQTNNGSVKIQNGWNIISVPVTATDMTKVNLFSSSNSYAFTFNNGYSTATTLENGKGYWLKFPSNQSLQINGTPVTKSTITVTSGWNLIGGYDKPLLVNNITSTPPGIISSSFFGYNNGYFTADTLKPGKGYWLKASQSGVLNISSALAKGKVNEPILTNIIKKDWGRIIISDAKDKSNVLYMGKDIGGVNSYELPPKPPTGVFDVRFSSSNSYVENMTGTKEIEISTDSYPVTISISNMKGIRIYDKTTGGKLIDKTISEGSEIVITNKSVKSLVVEEKIIPTVFSLEQNYPNPFNPSTTIKYGLPENTRVRLTLYNTLGQKVEEILNQEQEAGYHKIIWNGSKYASGVYIYRIEAGRYSNAKKLVLMK